MLHEVIVCLIKNTRIHTLKGSNVHQLAKPHAVMAGLYFLAISRHINRTASLLQSCCLVHAKVGPVGLRL